MADDRRLRLVSSLKEALENHKVEETPEDKAYNEGYDRGFGVGSWMVDMLVSGPIPFIIPVNPYEANTEDYMMEGYNGWRDGFGEAINVYMQDEDCSFHEILVEYVGRMRKSSVG